MSQITQFLAYIGPLLFIALKVGVVVGALGSAIEALGVFFKLPRLVALGKALEAYGSDIPKWIKNAWAILPDFVKKLIPGFVPPAALMLLALHVTACAGWKPIVKDIDQAAIILCDVFFSEQPNAKGLSPADVEKAFCSTAEQVAPFLDSAKKAAGRGGAIRLSKVPQ